MGGVIRSLGVRNDTLDGGAGNATVGCLGGMTRISMAQATIR